MKRYTYRGTRRIAELGIEVPYSAEIVEFENLAEIEAKYTEAEIVRFVNEITRIRVQDRAARNAVSDKKEMIMKKLQSNPKLKQLLGL